MSTPCKLYLTIMKNWLTLCVACLFFLSLASLLTGQEEKEKIKVPVLPFTSGSSEVGEGTALALTSVLVDELKNSSRLSVADRRDLDKSLREKFLGISGYCETSCKKEMNQQLGSDFAATGEINAIVDKATGSRKFIVTLKWLDVTNGEAVWTDKETYTGSATDLDGPVTLLARRLRNYLEGGKTVTVQPDETAVTEPFKGEKAAGTLSINTTPPGATVILGADSAGKTPLTLKVPTGKHEVTLSLTGYEDIPKVVTIEKDKTTEVTEEFKRQTGTISVDSTPAGASVYLDGSYKGQTPLELKYLALGTHAVRVEIENYADQEKSVDVKYKDTTKINFNLQPLPGKLAVTSTPQNASVSLDGKNAGKTPVYGFSVSPGSHSVSVSLSGYKTQAETVDILANQPKTLNFSLEPGATTVPLASGSVDADMALIYAGEFYMGSGDSDSMGQSDTTPKHKVYLAAYYIDKYEVTNAQYKECVDAGTCNKPQDTEWYNDSGKATHPVVYVDWNQANAYCTWAGKRLPTEAEWEKAARGESGTIWPWGNEFDCSKSCNSVSPCKQSSTCAVGSFPSDVLSYGVYDMAGNVWEWVSDWYDENYYKNSPAQNPKGPNDGKYRVLRGGSWSGYDMGLFWGANRGRGVPTGRDGGNGFRCAADVK